MTAMNKDTKDWTWVLERECPECGLASARVGPRDVGALLRDSADRWTRVLARPDVGDRPDQATWSPLEYGAHVRDVHRVFLGRLELMLREDDPLFDDWDQDEAAELGEYASQDPAVVAEDLAAGGQRLADAFDAVAADEVERPGRRSNGSSFTVRTLGQYLVHDVLHHLHDVRG